MTRTRRAGRKSRRGGAFGTSAASKPFSQPAAAGETFLGTDGKEG